MRRCGFRCATSCSLNSEGSLQETINRPRGIWQEEHDEIIVAEVMCDELEIDWWRDYRRRMERLFRQDEILISATRINRI